MLTQRSAKTRQIEGYLKRWPHISMGDVGKKFGVTREWVRQIKTRMLTGHKVKHNGQSATL